VQSSKIAEPIPPPYLLSTPSSLHSETDISQRPALVASGSRIEKRGLLGEMKEQFIILWTSSISSGRVDISLLGE